MDSIEPPGWLPFFWLDIRAGLCGNSIIGDHAALRTRRRYRMAGVLRLQHTSIPMPADGRDAARRFFGQALGMTEVLPPSSLDRDRLVWFQAGSDGHEIHLFEDAELSRKSSAQHLCLQVDDVEAFRRRMAEHGVEVEETQAIHNRPRFFVHDPFDNLIEITQITGDYT
jgi:catechol 2,3-dioxygenase-like lactoylglutathione lyase family enzyme